MSWHIGKHPDCDKDYAVIKNDDGSLAGCHDTEEKAKEQMRALYANEGKVFTEDEARSRMGLPPLEDMSIPVKASGEVRHKSFELVESKADPRTGEVVALASVFNSVDLVGDRVLPGAFTKSLEQWRDKGKPIPIIVSHKWDDPMSLIGGADPQHVYETEKGLMVRGKLHIDRNPVAAQVHHLMAEELLTGWSFGYIVPEGGEKMKNGVNEVSEVELVEAGPTLKGAHPEAQLQAVKSLTQINVPVDIEPLVKTAAVEDAERMSDEEMRSKVHELALNDATGQGVTGEVQTSEPEIEAPEKPEESEEPEQPSEGQLRRASKQVNDEVAKRAREIALEEALGRPPGKSLEKEAGFKVGGFVPAGSTLVVLDGDLILTKRQMEQIEYKATTAPWSGAASRFTDEQYARSCILDRAKCGSEWASKPAKQRYSLPIREPGGALNVNAVHAAAARINQVDACPAAKSAAKAKLRGAYAQIGEEVPDSIKSLETEVQGGGSQPRPSDPLHKRTNDVALELALGRDPRAVPPNAREDEPEPEPELPSDRELRRRTEQTALDIALGGSHDAQ